MKKAFITVSQDLGRHNNNLAFGGGRKRPQSQGNGLAQHQPGGGAERGFEVWGANNPHQGFTDPGQFPGGIFLCALKL